MTLRRAAILLGVASSIAIPAMPASGAVDRQVILVVAPGLPFEDALREPLVGELARSGGIGLLTTSGEAEAEAAAAAGLPVAFHSGGIDHHRGAGWPSFYLEEHVWNGNVMAAAALSLVCEGVFENVPDLQVVFVEGGVTWCGPLMWALDNAWAMLREEVPHLRRRPSEYIREHVWFTTQPIEEPDDPRHVVQALEHMAMGDRVMFATDYPHWDYDAPARALPRAIGAELRAKIFASNACRLYGLPRDARRA